MKRRREIGIWPWSSATALFLSAGLMVIVIGVLAWLRVQASWPPSGSDNILLIGLFLIGLTPLILLIVHEIISRGGKVKAVGWEIDFGTAVKQSAVAFELKPGLIDPGLEIHDSGAMDIRKSLRSASRSPSVKLNLSEGQGWWETRLLLLLAAADRLGGPKAVVFVDNTNRLDDRFLAFGFSQPLLRAVLRSSAALRERYYQARRATEQWLTLAPTTIAENVITWHGYPEAVVPKEILSHPRYRQIMAEIDAFDELAKQRPFEAFQPSALDQQGLIQLRNEFLAEQMLAQALVGLEPPHSVVPPTQISEGYLRRLEDASEEPVLFWSAIDIDQSEEEQLRYILRHDIPYFAVTQSGAYRGVLSAELAHKETLRALLRRDLYL